MKREKLPLNQTSRGAVSLWRWWVVFGFLVALVVGVFVAFRREAAGEIALPVAREKSGAFAGSATCAECHAKEVAQWKASHHFLAERELGEAEREGFLAKRALPNQAGVARLNEHGLAEFLGKGFSREQVEILPVVRMIGEAPLRQFLVRGPRGELQAHEAAWDPAKREWFSVFGDEARSRGEWGHWTGRGMNWESQCAACHNTNFQKHYDAATDRYHATMAEASVSCESCHGGMRDHVDWQKSGRLGAEPARRVISRDEMLATCAACHARRGELTGKMVAGAKLLDHFQLAIPDESPAFFPDGQIHEEDYEANAFFGSKMHAAGVRCVDCHNPHTGKLVQEGNALCMQCHSGGKRDGLTQPARRIDPQAHSFHGAESAGNQCISCHMPETTFMQRHPRHDHGFTIPQPRMTKQFQIPNACNRCHSEQSVDWAIEKIDQWYGANRQPSSEVRTTAIALARAGDSRALPALLPLLNMEKIPLWRASVARMLSRWSAQPEVREKLLLATRDADPLVRGSAVQALASEASEPLVRAAMTARLQDDTRWVRIEAAWVLRADLDLATPAAKDLLGRLAQGADQPLGQLQLGQFEFARNHRDKALIHFAKAVEWDAQSAPFRHDYAIALSMAGQVKLAQQQLAEAVKLAPDQPDYYYKYGLILSENGERAQAISALERAVELAPEFAAAWYNLAIAYAQHQQISRAHDAAQRALDLEPSNPRAIELLRSLPPP